ncbi:nitrate- and nitrite sensing domain-containing protein [Nocardia carnea]|uniref:nitrate- and nitrite sensing domain-containing protein n=1 Tax=Nocardia carnea TaxID=37328 RepID=UPI002453E8F8|nr:nitrate- and nitrite sensing domain-containing protein [Nocardia carnea]
MRLLSILLVTNITLLIIGVSAAGYLVKDSLAARVWANLISSTTTPVISMVETFEEERRLSMLYLEGDPVAADALVAARERSDTALAATIAKGEAAQRLDPGGSAAELETFRPLYNSVPGFRATIDARAVPSAEAFGFFNTVIDTIFRASLIAARVAPDAGLGIALGYGVEPLRAAEALSRADTLGIVSLARGTATPEQFLEFHRHVGEFRAQAAYSASVLKGARLDQLHALTSSPDWQQVTAMQDAMVLRGPFPSESDYETGETAQSGPATLPMTGPAWQEASTRLSSALLKLWEDQSRDAHAIAREEGTDTASLSLIGGIVVLIVTLVAFLGTLFVANRFIARMRRLRSDTLELADHRLPDLMRRLDSGVEIDTAAEVARLDFGTDELGEVADAFNRAQVAAVSAAVAESRTRAGFRTVFLNIAHRNQVAVHKQLALLDRAERREENAEQLELLFELDHLATRARRHAENLIVLGGENPGRVWHKPIPLWDLIRGAAAETVDYTRIHTGSAPDVLITGQATADLIHLLAELMDNATAFSPPKSRVEVVAAVVGRGVAIEVADQGLGMSADEIVAANQLLAQPPDFGVAALSGDTRLGLFVVATLAARHGASVRLSDSVYGGVKAVVLIPTELVVEHNTPAAGDPADATADATGGTADAGPSDGNSTTAQGNNNGPTRPGPDGGNSTTLRVNNNASTDTPVQNRSSANPRTNNSDTAAPRTNNSSSTDPGPNDNSSTAVRANDDPLANRRANNGNPGEPRTSGSGSRDAGTNAGGSPDARANGGAANGAGSNGGTGPAGAPVSTQPSGSARPAAEQAAQQSATDARPPLPRRHRQTAEPVPSAEPATGAPRPRSAEDARDLMAAIEGGTRSGRSTLPEAAESERTRQEGDDDHSRAH